MSVLNELKRELEILKGEEDANMKGIKRNERLTHKVDDAIIEKKNGRGEILKSLDGCNKHLEKFESEKNDIADSKNRLELDMKTIDFEMKNKCQEITIKMKDEDEEVKKAYEMKRKSLEWKKQVCRQPDSVVRSL
ncbi:hypothetical protein QAD02_023889 [Eretmocerus hayati]|uniref:Uncharacterized protein n=1 Tax=Eretmocerus hayati TaxID=131215 RepID=A0ACC2PXU6_9HYME|nr:hypothetical protein QAD02_023889 [Eretmocerus hayati]